jgi:hypothetical protein
MTNSQTSPGVEGYAILELLGHRRLAGWLSEQEIAGHGFIRLDTSTEGGSLVTSFHAPASVYAITPCTEEIAREIARSAPKPVERWDLRGLLPAETARMAPVHDLEYDMDEDYHEDELHDEHQIDHDDGRPDDDGPHDEFSDGGVEADLVIVEVGPIEDDDYGSF